MTTDETRQDKLKLHRRSQRCNTEDWFCMARINVEDSIYRDLRFIKLVAKHGHFAALGMMVCAWGMAQKNFLSHEGIISFEEWEYSGLEDLVTFRLAEKRENGIYVKGTTEQFAWLKQRQDCGKLGGRPRKNPKPEETGRLTELTGSNPLTLTLTQSLTPKFKGDTRARASAAPPPEKLVFDTYAEAYEKRYGRRIAYSAAKGRLCRLLIEELGSVENASEAAKTFLTSDRPFHVQRGHSLDVLLKDCDTAYTVSHIRKQN